MTTVSGHGYYVRVYETANAKAGKLSVVFAKRLKDLPKRPQTHTFPRSMHLTAPRRIQGSDVIAAATSNAALRLQNKVQQYTPHNDWGHTKTRGRSGVAAFMSAHSKTPYITPSMGFPPLFMR